MFKDFTGRSYGRGTVQVTAGDVDPDSHEEYGVAYLKVEGDIAYLSRKQLGELIETLQQIQEVTKPTTLPEADGYQMENGNYIVPIPGKPGYFANLGGTVPEQIEKLKRHGPYSGLTLNYWTLNYGKTFVPISVSQRIVVDVTKDEPVTIG